MVHAPKVGPGQAVRVSATGFSGTSQSQTAGPPPQRGRTQQYTAGACSRGGRHTPTPTKKQPEDQLLGPVHVGHKVTG